MTCREGSRAGKAGKKEQASARGSQEGSSGRAAAATGKQKRGTGAGREWCAALRLQALRQHHKPCRWAVRLGYTAVTLYCCTAAPHLDKVVVRLARLDALQQVARIADARGHRHSDLRGRRGGIAWRSACAACMCLGRQACV